MRRALGAVVSPIKEADIKVIIKYVLYISNSQTLFYLSIVMICIK